MGILGKIEDWMDRRKEAKPNRRKLSRRSRKNLGLVDSKCPECGHHKAFIKNEVLKCTKCGYRMKA